MVCITCMTHLNAFMRKLTRTGRKRKGKNQSRVQENIRYICFSREEEGIELQVLSNKTSEPKPGASGSFISYAEAGALPSTDADSLESTEYQQNETKDTKPSSTIGKKICVYRISHEL